MFNKNLTTQQNWVLKQCQHVVDSIIKGDYSNAIYIYGNTVKEINCQGGLAYRAKAAVDADWRAVKSQLTAADLELFNLAQRHFNNMTAEFLAAVSVRKALT